MAKTLTKNVYIHGTEDEPGGWFGPDYPDNKPSDAQLKSVAGNAALFEEDDDEEVETPGPGQTSGDLEALKKTEAAAKKAAAAEAKKAAAEGGSGGQA